MATLSIGPVSIDYAGDLAVGDQLTISGTVIVVAKNASEAIPPGEVDVQITTSVGTNWDPATVTAVPGSATKPA